MLLKPHFPMFEEFEIYDSIFHLALLQHCRICVQALKKNNCLVKIIIQYSLGNIELSDQRFMFAAARNSICWKIENLVYYPIA